MKPKFLYVWLATAALPEYAKRPYRCWLSYGALVLYSSGKAGWIGVLVF